MTRTAVPIDALTDGVAGTIQAATSVTSSNDASIAAGGDTQKLLVLITNASGGDLTATFKAGAGAAFQASLGDLVVTVANGTTKGHVITSARFAQADGLIHIDPSGTMTFSAIRLD